MDSWLFCTVMKPVLNMDWIYTKKSFLGLIECSALSDWSLQVEDNTNRLLSLTQRWPRPLNRGYLYKEVKVTAIKEKKIWDSDHWPLNTGWPLNTVLLNISLTVSFIQQQWQLFMTTEKKTYIAQWRKLLLSFPVSLHCLRCKYILLHCSCYYWRCSTVWCLTN